MESGDYYIYHFIIFIDIHKRTFLSFFSPTVYIDTPRIAERDRFSPYPMICVSKALSIVLNAIKVPKKRHLVNLHAGKHTGKPRFGF